MRTSESRCRVGIDIGGTFTDAALEVGDKRFTTKVLTTPQAPERGVLQALQIVVSEAAIEPRDIDLIIHGTTLATNALIERKGATTALITTDGFRDVLEIRNEDRFEQYDPFLDPPKPLVPRRLRFVVPERIDARGKVLLPLDENRVREVADLLGKAGVQAIAIGFLHSYVNPAHELRAAELIREQLGNVPVSLSHRVSPEMREYERISTTCANAYVQPKMAGYLRRLSDQLVTAGFKSPMLLMLSGGGLTTVETSVEQPIRLVESGPAGGAIFSSFIARQCGLDRVLSFDMGGTTAKICLIDDGKPQASRSFEVARIYRFKKGSGLPLRIPVIEMVEIGAGGGSIARVDKLSRITVGPDSAGSEPGPACYGRGGPHATVTDADLALGRIDADQFAGGRIRLGNKAAADALGKTIGEPLGLAAELAAFGVAEIVDENMASAARVHAIESGKDISNYTMIAFGGAAPLHAARIAEKLNIRRFIVPSGAGVGSTVGFLRAPIAYEIVRSGHCRLSSFDHNWANSLITSMQDEARAVVKKAAFDAALTESRIAFMRYVGQGHEIAVPLPVRPFAASDVAHLRSLFDDHYRRVYSRVIPGGDIEILTWSLTVSTNPDQPSPATTSLERKAPAPVGQRRVFDPSGQAWIELPVYDRKHLAPGCVISGPAIIVEAETSTFVTKHFEARIDALGYIDCHLRSNTEGARQ
jgi:N-methylhydantoinase A